MSAIVAVAGTVAILTVALLGALTLVLAMRRDGDLVNGADITDAGGHVALDGTRTGYSDEVTR